jgi:hypothetical protein
MNQDEDGKSNNSGTADNIHDRHDAIETAGLKRL